MKANPRSRAPLFRPALPTVLSSSLLAAMLAGCVPPPPSGPAPTPTPQTPAYTAPRPAAPPVADWRDAPITPGDWTYAANASGSVANFAGGQFSLRCDLRSHAVTLTRTAPPGAQQAPASLGVTTADTSRALPAQASPAGIAVTLPGSDRLLDSMAFSRGRFAVTTHGAPPLYIPSWTEVTRVVEDCR